LGEVRIGGSNERAEAELHTPKNRTSNNAVRTVFSFRTLGAPGSAISACVKDYSISVLSEVGMSISASVQNIYRSWFTFARPG
jgi:hypothetical protein